MLNVAKFNVINGFPLLHSSIAAAISKNLLDNTDERRSAISIQIVTDQDDDMATTPTTHQRSLTCIATGGRALHHLSIEHSGTELSSKALSASIVTTPLPISELTDSDAADTKKASLPLEISSALELDPPLELLSAGLVRSSVDAVDGNAVYSRDAHFGESSQQATAMVELLVVYSRSRVFVLYYACVDRKVISYIEPFEEILMDHFNATSRSDEESSSGIIRVRSAPTFPGSRSSSAASSSSAVSLAPPGSMAMLLSTGVFSMYHHHHNRKARCRLTKHDLINRADAELDALDPAADFCFGCPDNDDSGSYLGEISVFLLHRSGDIYGAAPLCFDGSVVHRDTMSARLGYLEDELRNLRPPLLSRGSSPGKRLIKIDDIATNDAKWRQIKASMRWILDVYGDLSTSSDTNRNSHYVTARLESASSKSAINWPITLQGPLIFGRTEVGVDGVPCAPASIIEHMESPRSCPMSLFATGRESGQLDICALSAPIQMRFSLESEIDAHVLGDETARSGAVIQSVLFDQGDQSDEEIPSSLKSLVVDPLSSNLIHVGTSRGAHSVSTGVAGGFDQWLTDLKGNFQPKFRASAWSCMKVSVGASVAGMVATADPQLGHVLYILLSTGAIEPVNITALKYLSEAASAATAPMASSEESKHHKVSNMATHVLDKLDSFSTISSPLIASIAKGITSVGKISGSSTFPGNAGAAEVASFVAIKSSIDTDVILPMKELDHKTKERKSIQKELYENQTEQLQAIKKIAAEIKDRSAALRERKESIEENARLLSQRSAAVLAASMELVPKLSQAEVDYFNQLRRWESQCYRWQSSLSNIQSRVSHVSDSWDSSSELKVEMSEQEQNNCQTLLIGQGHLLKKSKEALKKMRTSVVVKADHLGLELSDT